MEVSKWVDSRAHHAVFLTARLPKTATKPAIGEVSRLRLGLSGQTVSGLNAILGVVAEGDRFADAVRMKTGPEPAATL